MLNFRALTLCLSLSRRANAWKVSFLTLYSGQFTLSTDLIIKQITPLYSPTDLIRSHVIFAIKFLRTKVIFNAFRKYIRKVNSLVPGDKHGIQWWGRQFKLAFNQGWPQTLDTGERLMEAKITAHYRGYEYRDFDSQSLKTWVTAKTLLLSADPTASSTSPQRFQIS